MSQHRLLFFFEIALLLALASSGLAAPSTLPATLPSTRPAAPKEGRELVNAIRRRSVARVQQLIDQGAAVNTEGYSPLYEAVLSRSTPVTKLLLDRGANPNSVNSWGCSALYRAAYWGDAPMVELLLDRGADREPASGNIPLIAAAYANSADVVRLLLSKGAKVNAADRRGVTALHAAAFEGNREVTKFLIAAGADANAHDHNGATPDDEAKRGEALLRDYAHPDDFDARIAGYAAVRQLLHDAAKPQTIPATMPNRH